MKTNVLVLLAAFVATLLSSGCATMAENRAANRAFESELQTVLTLQEKKFHTAKPILIIGHNAEAPNSAGGVDFTLTFQNTGEKVIKYLRVKATAINRVGDLAPCSIRGTPEAVLTATGPYPTTYNGNGGVRWDTVWYNSAIAFARIDYIDIDFMDGSHEHIEGAALKAAQLRPENNEFAANLQQTRKLTIVDDHMYIVKRHDYEL